MPDTFVNLGGHNSVMLDTTDGLLHVVQNDQGTLTDRGTVNVGATPGLVALAATVVSAAASATIQALLTAAGVTISPTVKRITLIPAGTVYLAIGGAASVASVPLVAGYGYEIDATALTDLRLYAALATNVSVIQEG
jgi:hypothetical protein